MRRRARWFPAAWLIVALTAACAGGAARAPAPATGATPTLPAGAQSVASVVFHRPAGGSVDVVAYVDPPPEGDVGGTPQPGCPVVLDRLPTLTDYPFARSFSVAGVSLPNSVPQSLSSLRLVIPLDRGLIEVPLHARLRGHFNDPAYARCSGGSGLFVLDVVEQPLPGAEVAASGTTVATSGWHDDGVGLGLSYPAGWTVSVTRNVGAIVQARFQGTPTGRTIQLAVIAGQTLATPDAETDLPESLVGARQLPALLGPAQARLVDAPGDATPDGQSREVRLVANYQGNTVVLSVRFEDGLALDHALLDTFTALAASVRFDRSVEASDPLDPTLTASATLGKGPFISRGRAETAAVAASGLRQATVADARLVAEREARLTGPGTCREFQGRPQGVWLVTVQGTQPTGQDARMLVYLDASTAERLCQAPAPPAAP